MFLYRQTQDNNQKTALGQVSWQAGMDRLDKITALNHELLQVADSRSLIETHFSKSSDIVPFLDSIEGLAPLAGKGTKVEISAVALNANKTGLVVDLKVSGSFTSIYKFLTLLENSPYELDFPSVSMQKSSAVDPSSKNTIWEAMLKVQLLSFVP